MKTVKAICGLCLLPVLLPFVCLLHLSRSYETRQFVRHFWACAANDCRTIWAARGFLHNIAGLCLVLGLGVACVTSLWQAHWGAATGYFISAVYLSLKS